MPEMMMPACTAERGQFQCIILLGGLPRQQDGDSAALTHTYGLAVEENMHVPGNNVDFEQSLNW